MQLILCKDKNFFLHTKVAFSFYVIFLCLMITYKLSPFPSSFADLFSAHEKKRKGTASVTNITILHNPTD